MHLKLRIGEDEHPEEDLGALKCGRERSRVDTLHGVYGALDHCSGKKVPVKALYR